MLDYPDGRFGVATINDGGTWRPAVLTGRGVAPLTALLGPDAPSSVRAMVTDGWDGWCDRIAAALEQVSDLGWAAEGDVTFGPPLPDTSNVYMAGANYYDHWSVQEQIALLSAQAPLFPGDVILTGTPAGTAAAHGAYLVDGDVLTTAVEGLGALVNRVVPANGIVSRKR